ncbi:hypothetical protein [Sphingomonas sp. HMP6]|uniref:hypothetical protein n=1 Tax=Sphingomonas sp. HMP6 TaxID=1517551 RepID=UPI001596A016|nr:hypothetical protein [Sphingomonas sp. HMP6]BCA57359.1 hypothetical protein HMP06_0128 [Sphingomonas sp. HMP6]
MKVRILGRTTAILLWTALLGATTANAKSDAAHYEGADAGCLIYSVGTVKIGMNFTFPYGPIKSPGDKRRSPWAGEIKPKVGGAIRLQIKDPDFVGTETGHVVVRCLPPGDYAVGSFAFSGSLPGVGSYEWSPEKPFAFPFRIRSGEATYIGSFMRAPSAQTPLQPILGMAGFFVVADRNDRDLPIARTRLSPSMQITRQVTDVSSFNSAALQTDEP